MCSLVNVNNILLEEPNAASLQMLRHRGLHACIWPTPFPISYALVHFVPLLNWLCMAKSVCQSVTQQCCALLHDSIRNVYGSRLTGKTFHSYSQSSHIHRLTKYMSIIYLLLQNGLDRTCLCHFNKA